MLATRSRRHCGCVLTKARNSPLVTSSVRRRNGATCAGAVLPSAGSTLTKRPPGRATYSAAAAGNSASSKTSASHARISVLRRHGRTTLGARAGHFFLADPATGVVPAVQHVGEDVRHLVIGQLRHRRHHRVVLVAVDRDLAGQA